MFIIEPWQLLKLIVPQAEGEGFNRRRFSKQKLTKDRKVLESIDGELLECFLQPKAFLLLRLLLLLST
jgi:hypothetical protein